MVVDNNSKRNPANSKNPDLKESCCSMGGFWEQVKKETNENEGLPNSRRGFAKVLLSPVPKKKILGERNVVVVDDAPPPPPSPLILAMQTTTTPKEVQGILLSSPAAAAAYDPVTNFTSPRPEFLRYNPNRRREILQRMEVGDMKDFESSSSSSDDQAGNEEEEQEELASLIESPLKSTSQEEKEGGAKQGVEKEDGDYEVDDDAMEEEERPWPSRSRMVWKLLFIFGLFFISCHYLFPTTPFHQEEEEEITIPHRPTNWLSRSDHLLTTHLGVSDLCLSTAGEIILMCPIDGHTCSSSSLVVDDEEEEIHIIIGSSRPTIREEEGCDLVMSDEVVTGMVHSQVEVVERDDDDSSQAQLGADTTLVPDHPVEDDGQLREECENIVEETLRDDEAIERNNDILRLKSEKVQQAASLEEDTELVEKSQVHLTETPHSTPQLDQASEESKFSIISQSANHLVYFSREVPFIFIWMSLLLAAAAAAAALVGFSSFLLFKYFVKPSSRNTLLPSVAVVEEEEEEMRNIEVVEEKRIMPAVVVEEESRDINKDSTVSNLSLDQLREKYGEFSLERRQPTLQLLGEFSLAESEIELERAEEPHTCQYKMRSSTLRNSPSSSSNKLHPPPSTESTLEGSYRPGKKLRKTEDSSNKSEEKMVATPLRRSDRLRKRVTSP